MTAALEGGEWSVARPGRTLPPGKNRYPFYRRLGGPQGRSGRAENLVPTGIRSRTVQPVVSRYTDWATRPTDDCRVWCLIYAQILPGQWRTNCVPRKTHGPAVDLQEFSKNSSFIMRLLNIILFFSDCTFIRLPIQDGLWLFLSL